MADRKTRKSSFDWADSSDELESTNVSQPVPSSTESRPDSKIEALSESIRSQDNVVDQQDIIEKLSIDLRKLNMDKEEPPIKKIKVDNNSTISCYVCKGPHTVYECLKNKSMDEVEAVVKDKGLCINCFSNKHIYPNCKSHRRCKICRRKHNTLLHVDKELPNSRSCHDTEALTDKKTLIKNIKEKVLNDFYPLFQSNFNFEHLKVDTRDDDIDDCKKAEDLDLRNQPNRGVTKKNSFSFEVQPKGSLNTEETDCSATTEEVSHDHATPSRGVNIVDWTVDLLLEERRRQDQLTKSVLTLTEPLATGDTQWERKLGGEQSNNRSPALRVQASEGDNLSGGIQSNGKSGRPFHERAKEHVNGFPHEGSRKSLQDQSYKGAEPHQGDHGGGGKCPTGQRRNQVGPSGIGKEGVIPNQLNTRNQAYQTENDGEMQFPNQRKRRMSFRSNQQEQDQNHHQSYDSTGTHSAFVESTLKKCQFKLNECSLYLTDQKRHPRLTRPPRWEYFPALKEYAHIEDFFDFMDQFFNHMRYYRIKASHKLKCLREVIVGQQLQKAIRDFPDTDLGCHMAMAALHCQLILNNFFRGLEFMQEEWAHERRPPDPEIYTSQDQIPTSSTYYET